MFISLFVLYLFGLLFSLDVLKDEGERQHHPEERMRMLVIMIPVMMMKMTVTMMMVPEEECARSHNKFIDAVFQSFMFGNEKFMYQNYIQN